jgi:hypothetical protein
VSLVGVPGVLSIAQSRRCGFPHDRIYFKPLKARGLAYSAALIVPKCFTKRFGTMSAEFAEASILGERQLR